MPTARLQEPQLTPTERAYIGLGGNVGDPPATLAAAIRALDSPAGTVRGVSRLYRTRPVGVSDQPDFHNAVAALELPGGADPQTEALALLGKLKALERSLGRIPGVRWGPRLIDLDLLLFGGWSLRVARPASRGGAGVWLEVPHPQLAERLFVLAPLAELAPDLVPAGRNESIVRLRDRRLAIEGEEAVRVVGRWDAAASGWVET